MMLFKVMRARRREASNMESHLLTLRKRRIRARAIALYGTALALFAFLAAGAGWLVLRSSAFAVAEIRVVGNARVSGEAIRDVLWASVRPRGLWGIAHVGNLLSWPDGLGEDALRLLPAVKRVAIEKDYRSRVVTARVEERAPVGIWCADAGGSLGRCYWFDETGTLFGAALRAEGSAIPNVRDVSGETPGIGKHALPESQMKHLRSVLTVLRQSGLGIFELVIRDRVREEVEAGTREGPRLYFSLRFPAENTLEILRTLARDPSFRAFSFVDMRVENRVYYK